MSVTHTKHLDAQRDRPYAALRVTPAGSSRRGHPVMLSRSEASRYPTRQTLRCAQVTPAGSSEIMPGENQASEFNLDLILSRFIRFNI